MMGRFIFSALASFALPAAALIPLPSNPLPNGNNFSAWQIVNAQLVPDTLTAAPNGTITAQDLVESTADGTHYISEGQVNYTPGQTVTASVYLQGAGDNQIVMQLQDPTGSHTLSALCDIAGKAATASTSNGATAQSASLTPAGNGWFLCSMTGVVATPVTSPIGKPTASLLSGAPEPLFPLPPPPPTQLQLQMQIFLAPHDSLSYYGNGKNGVNLWQAAVTYSSPTSPLGWIADGSVLSMLINAGGQSLPPIEVTPLIEAAFNQSNAFIGHVSNNIPLTSAQTIQTYTSYQCIAFVLTGGANPGTCPDLPNGTQAILYDNENWAFTPTEEQQNPVKYAALAAALVHAHHLKLIVTPATNLAGVIMGKDLGGYPDRYRAFLALNILGRMALTADVVEFQAQGLQGTPAYATYVQAASDQVWAANPHVLFYAGMSTNPGGIEKTSQQLFDDYQSTRQYTSGYWMNIPKASPYCPGCGQAQPGQALGLLQLLY